MQSLKLIVGFYLLNVVMPLDFDCTGIPPLQLNAHPTDCRAFVICINDNPMASSCPDGMHFNFVMQNCISGDCENDTTTEEATTTKQTTTEVTTTTGEITSEVIIETTTEQEVITDEITTTQETTTADESTSEERTTTKEISTTEEVTTEVFTTQTESEIDTPTPNPEVEEGIECPNDRPNENIFFPSKIDCERYYICNTGNVYPMWCREGFHFNPDINKCDYPELANCTLDTDNGEVDEDGIPLCDKNRDMYYLPHPHQCSYFIFCLLGNRYISPCPLYKSWDVITGQCIDSNLATCAPGATKFF